MRTTKTKTPRSVSPKRWGICGPSTVTSTKDATTITQGPMLYEVGDDRVTVWDANHQPVDLLRKSSKRWMLTTEAPPQLDLASARFLRRALVHAFGPDVLTDPLVAP